MTAAGYGRIGCRAGPLRQSGCADPACAVGSSQGRSSVRIAQLQVVREAYLASVLEMHLHSDPERSPTLRVEPEIGGAIAAGSNRVRKGRVERVDHTIDPIEVSSRPLDPDPPCPPVVALVVIPLRDAQPRGFTHG